MHAFGFTYASGGQVLNVDVQMLKSSSGKTAVATAWSCACMDQQ